MTKGSRELVRRSRWRPREDDVLDVVQDALLDFRMSLEDWPSDDEAGAEHELTKALARHSQRFRRRRRPHHPFDEARDGGSETHHGDEKLGAGELGSMLRLLKPLLPHALAALNDRYHDAIVARHGLEAVGITYREGDPFLDLADAGRRQLLCRALHSFSRRLEALWKDAARTEGHHPQLADEAVEFLCGQKGVDPVRLLAELSEALRALAGPKRAA